MTQKGRLKNVFQTTFLIIYSNQFTPIRQPFYSFTKLTP